MVYYFTTVNGLMVYMGKDKHENELLIKYGWPEDIWFHVDDLSSAHVYLRLPRGPLRKTFRATGTLDHLPKEDLNDLLQLTKGNSISGSKKHDVSICYTEWENLRKDNVKMDTGTIGFHDYKKVQHVLGVAREREVLKRIEKTKTEAFPDHAEERRKRDVKVMQKKKARVKAQKEAARKEKAARKAEADRRDYKHILKEEDMVANTAYAASEDTSAAVAFEDDFM